MFDFKLREKKLYFKTETFQVLKCDFFSLLNLENIKLTISIPELIG
jgi:hypothetical protein